MHLSRTSRYLYPLSVSAVVILSCVSLFMLDRETHSVADIFKPGNIIALFIYSVPMMVFCQLAFRFFSRKLGRNASFALACILGIPVSFLMVALVMAWRLGWF